MQFAEYFTVERITKMEQIAEGISDFGDFKAILFRASNGRHFVRFEPLNSSENLVLNGFFWARPFRMAKTLGYMSKN